MLKFLHLKNFKSARNLDFRLAPLTVLTGLNGSGKSSVLQSIALVKQSLDVEPDPKRLFLQGALIRLGRSEDVHFEDAATSELSIGIDMEGTSVSLGAKAAFGDDALDMSCSGDTQVLRAFLRSGFQFIQADRLTPATQYLQAGTQEEERGWLGCRGEYTVDYLHRHQDDHVSAKRQCRATDEGWASPDSPDTWVSPLSFRTVSG